MSHITDSVVIGSSPRMRAVFDFLRVLAGSEGNVLITGERGTGKHLIARLIHEASRRRDLPMTTVSCGLAELVVDAELFGCEGKAAGGEHQPGQLELAGRGTLFLEDVDDMPPVVQARLARALQHRAVDRAGSVRMVPINARILAASKRDLKRLVANGEFREDLYYRLNVVPIALPPLRERPEDIPVLTDAFLARFSRARGVEPPPVAPAVARAFAQYSWPGNVRELESTCERIAESCTCGVVHVGCVTMDVLAKAAEPEEEPEPLPSVSLEAPAGPVSLDDRLRALESSLISWALKESGGNKSRAAAMLQVKRSTLGDRIRHCGLDRPQDQPRGTS